MVNPQRILSKTKALFVNLPVILISIPRTNHTQNILGYSDIFAIFLYARNYVEIQISFSLS